MALHEWLQTARPSCYHNENVRIQAKVRQLHQCIRDYAEKQGHISAVNELYTALQ